MWAIEQMFRSGTNDGAQIHDSYFAAKVLLDLVERSFVRSIFLSVLVSI